MELTLGEKLKSIEKSFEFDMSRDSYENRDFLIEWLEGDLFELSEIYYDSDTGLDDCRRVDLMTEKQVLSYLKTYYYNLD